MPQGTGGATALEGCARLREGGLQHTITYANAWVASVDGGRRRLPGWAALLIAILTLALAAVAGPAAYRALPPPGAGFVSLALDRLALYACFVGPLLGLALLLPRFYEGRATAPASIRGWVAAPLGAILGAGFFALALGLTAALHGVKPGAGGAEAARRLAGPAVLALLILFQAGSEEVFFRGWLQPVLAARWGPWVGLCATSLGFAAAHAAFRMLGPIAWVNDTLAGFAFGLLALRTGGLAAPIAAHWGWNWAEAALFGATPNPGVDPLGALFDLDLAGPGWLAGGADEMNGSICATAALLGLIACAALWRPRSPPA